ncbi:MAG TPA: MBL fold metallo-hydrolase [Chloroflexi bacterium]|nr:MBL fold metallo-hydrolase [Chloroflexota bacterium]
MKAKQAIAFGLGGLAAAAAGGLVARFRLGRRRADREWAAARYPKLEDVGAVKRLTILPLIDWYTARDDLAGEPGVSYLVRADDTTILFDVGFNQREEHPSPLLRNMAALGVDVAEIDALVISHAHEDHVGGMSHMMQHTFALSGQPVDLRGIPAYVPLPLSNPTAQVTVVDGPRVVAPGVASIGPIPRQMFFLGWTVEQSLAVNVEEKGIVLIVGCGHPTLQRIVDRAEMLFDAPLYGLVGGLHYPVTGSREIKFGLPLQRLLGTGKWPWDPVNRQDVETAIAYLKRRNPQLVALSAHDSCDWSIEAFRQAFGAAYQDVLVGKEIVAG